MGYNTCNTILRMQNNKTNIATQRSGCDVERKNKRSGMDVPRLRRGTEWSAVCSDVVRAWGLEPQRIAAREPKSRMSANSIMPA